MVRVLDLWDGKHDTERRDRMTASSLLTLGKSLGMQADELQRSIIQSGTMVSMNVYDKRRHRKRSVRAFHTRMGGSHILLIASRGGRRDDILAVGKSDSDLGEDVKKKLNDSGMDLLGKQQH